MNKTKNILSILFIFIATLYLSVSISSIQVSDKQDNKAKSGQTIVKVSYHENLPSSCDFELAHVAYFQSFELKGVFSLLKKSNWISINPYSLVLKLLFTRISPTNAP